ncbi:MAG TPA: class I SAM-dependent methyltransferase [Methylocella sp.]|nr:class I SAM-dependent methyltransferase [Methylocella sp.]
MRDLDYTRQYMNWYDGSDSEFSKNVGMIAQMLKTVLPENKSASVLEIGSGMGFAVAAVKNLNYSDVEGMDADQGQVSAAKKRGLPVEHVPVLRTRTYLRDREGTKDFIFAFDVLEHIPKDEQVELLDLIFGALKPGGRFLCRVPNCNSAVATRMRDIDWTHHCSFSDTSLDFLLFNCGFRDISVDEASPNQLPALSSLLRPTLLKWLLRAYFRAHRRLELASEFGWTEAKRLPLSPNILAMATRPV